MAHDFALLPVLQTRIERVGYEAEPIVVIDGVMRSAGALVDYAVQEGRFETVAVGGYPGIRSSAPLDYVGALVRALDPIIQEAFTLDHAVLAAADCNLSIVTTRPDRLQPLQQVPHVDTDYPLQFAVLHYLCGSAFGGTAFYRHDATGYETLDPGRTPGFLKIRDGELAMRAPAPGYMQDAPAHYTQTAAFGAAFDRLLVYRSCILHCGRIPEAMPLIADPRQGRLTSNIFVSYRRST